MEFWAFATVIGNNSIKSPIMMQRIEMFMKMLLDLNELPGGFSWMAAYRTRDSGQCPFAYPRSLHKPAPGSRALIFFPSGKQKWQNPGSVYPHPKCGGRS